MPEPVVRSASFLHPRHSPELVAVVPGTIFKEPVLPARESHGGSSRCKMPVSYQPALRQHLQIQHVSMPN